MKAKQNKNNVKRAKMYTIFCGGKGLNRAASIYIKINPMLHVLTYLAIRLGHRWWFGDFFSNKHAWRIPANLLFAVAHTGSSLNIVFFL